MSATTPFPLPYEKRWAPDQVKECADLFELSPKQRSQLWELKKRLSDLKDYWANGPYELVRFVLEHTCHGNTDTMEKRFRKFVEWRKANGIDTVLETYSPPKLAYENPGGILEGLDKEGDIIVICRQGDVLGWIQRYGMEEVIQTLYWMNEFTIRGPWQKQFVKEHGYRPRTGTAIVDLKGMSPRHYHPSVLFMFHTLGGTLQTHYPHLVKKVLIINAPSVFRFVWGLFKPIIFAHLRALIEVANEAGTEALLEKYIDLEVLPEEVVPGKGRGKAVEGLRPNWEVRFVPPPSPSDWERPPILYPVRKDTASTICTESFCTESTVEREDDHNSVCAVRTTTKTLLKGTWMDSGAVTSEAVP